MWEQAPELWEVEEGVGEGPRAVGGRGRLRSHPERLEEPPSPGASPPLPQVHGVQGAQQDVAGGLGVGEERTILLL